MNYQEYQPCETSSKNSKIFPSRGPQKNGGLLKEIFVFSIDILYVFTIHAIHNNVIHVAREVNINLKTINPFRLGQYILKLLDVIKELRIDIKTLICEIRRLNAENEE